MMFRTHPVFNKMYAKLRAGEKRRFQERLILFLEQSFNPLLRVHQLHGKYDGYWSINIGGDLRALYKYETSGMVVFAKIGTHHELFGS